MQTISDLFQADHARLDNILVQFKQSLTGEVNVAKQHFADFKQGLEQHIVWEEEILFPYFNAYSGLVNGPIYVMKIEHTTIKQLLRDIEQQLNSEQVTPDNTNYLLELERTLESHNLKEENILYPKLDSLLNEQETQEIIAKVSAL